MDNDIYVQLRAELRNTLAILYANKNSISRIVDDAGLDHVNIDFDGSARDIWYSIISNAEKTNHLKQLLQVVVSPEEFGENQNLRDVVSKLMNHCYSDKQLNGDQFRLYYEEVEVPIVIAAMTEYEVDHLLSKNNVEEMGEMRRFQKEWTNLNLQKYSIIRKGFVDLLDKIPIGIKSLLHLNRGIIRDLKACYTKEQDDWRPVYCNDSIKEIIINAFDYLNNPYKADADEVFSITNNRRFVPNFISKSFFSNDEAIYTNAVAQLKNGGILIIDAFSLFYPDLHNQILQAEVGLNKQIAILVISPFNATDLPVNKQILDLFKRKFKNAHSRFYTQYDCLCDIDLGNMHNLTRWLIHATSHIDERWRLYEPLLENRKRFKEFRRGERPNGIHELSYR